MAHFVEEIWILEIRAVLPASGQLTLVAQGEFRSLRPVTRDDDEIALVRLFTGKLPFAPFWRCWPQRDHMSEKASCGQRHKSTLRNSPTS